MASSRHVTGNEKPMVSELLGALSDKHTQIDINLQGMNVRFPNTGMSVEFDGLLTITSHVRDMTDEEKKASATKNVALMA